MTTAPPPAPDAPGFVRTHRVLTALLALIGLVALALPAVVVLTTPTPVKIAKKLQKHQRVVPPAELPPVEPLSYINLTPDDARRINAAVPFSSDPNPAARPFRLPGADTDAERARALDCLAAAVLYEAGDDAEGERAVAQVVLNRVRHPAFPKTVCGVVFQGSERSTGCQFTFTCDGALARRWPDAAWVRARAIAQLALTGHVDKAVGHATHYHTDWVVPYWSASLDKVTAVGTHLFFRWTGWWGTPPAFNRNVLSAEPVIAALAPLSEAHRDASGLAAAPGSVDAATLANAALPVSTAADPDSFLVTLDKSIAPATYPALAARACGARPYCKFMAWTEASATPAGLPLNPQQVATMAFSYLRDTANGYDKPLWNCGQFERPQPSQCMKLQVLVPAAPKRVEDIFLRDLGRDTAPIPMIEQPAKRTPAPLAGVHHKDEPPAITVPQIALPRER
ncbi:cell wall hydrolase [Hephaestia sp. GCM10023244]|uniref:cell wall hydrolase n=1 Tax=unclassified Hephaestia TaxID=2631281 RepID=UPI0020773B20|nr:cell wall hydrolase [Hephaestia sp. MAHUQ-44]MCM8732101.1 cell wall hydrolase [Hephaestia sp. MAHUQ-44]